MNNLPMAFPDGINNSEAGMTLLDYFAAKAMQSLVGFRIEGRLQDTNTIATFAYQQAQAMMMERERLNPPKL